MITFKDYIHYPAELFQGGGPVATFNIGNESPTNGNAAQIAANVPINPIVQNPLDISSAFRRAQYDLQREKFDYTKVKDVMDFTSKIYGSVGAGVASSTSDTTGLYLPIYGEDEAEFNRQISEHKERLANAMFAGDNQGAMKLFGQMERITSDPNRRIAQENSKVLNAITNFNPKLGNGEVVDTRS